MLARKALLLTTLLASSAGTLSATPFWEQWTAHIPCMAFQGLPCPDITLWTRTSAAGSSINITVRNPHNVAEVFTPWIILGPGILDQHFLGAGWYAEGKVDSAIGLSGGAVGGPGNADASMINGLYIGNYSGSLRGCGGSLDPDGIAWVGNFRICPQNGFGGSVTYYYLFASQVRLPDLTYVQFYSGENGIGLFTAGQYSSPYVSDGPWGPQAICNDVLACTVTVAPEPSTWALLGGGLALIAAVSVARRRRQKTA
jgi:hypothetical protein